VLIAKATVSSRKSPLRSLCSTLCCSDTKLNL